MLNLLENKSARFYASSLGKLTLFLCAIFFVILSVNSLNAYSISCSFSTALGCDNYTLLLLKNDTGGYYNAHAQNVSVNTYSNALCCYSDAGLVRSCAQSTVLKIQNMTNSHVQVGNYSGALNYNIPICLSANIRNVSCTYSKGSCSAPYSCIGSIASSEQSDNNITNAHFGPCTEYDTKICCKINNPPTVTLANPTNGFATTNRTPMFNWTGNDDDGDTLTYEINLTAVLAPGGTSTCSDVILDTTANSYYMPSRDLYCLYDNLMYYKWSVRANDGSGYGEWSSTRIVNISALQAISLPVNTIDFGSMTVLQSNDTSDDSPLPFVIQNDGNSILNINVSATDLWNSVTGANIYYRYKIDNVSGELNAFNWSGSQTTFTNTPISQQFAISRLNYTNIKDSAETDIYVQVPPNEPPTIRNSTFTFFSYLGET